jgi:uncharacterized protein (DUF2267 family)
MSVHRPEVLSRTVQETDSWLEELREDLGLENHSQSYGALRSVLHALRDRLTVDMAVHLSAQMPVLLAGIYFDGWKPSQTPNDIERWDEFVADVALRAAGHDELDPNLAAQAVFALLERRLTPGQVEKVVGELPKQLQEIWRDLPAIDQG